MMTGAVFIFAGAVLIFMSRYHYSQNEQECDEGPAKARFRLPSYATLRVIFTVAAVIFIIAGAAFVTADVL
jgi:hypothetical protein